MSILRGIMIPNLFTRLITTWVTIAVIILHGITVWAMISVDSPRPLETKITPKAIQLELITLPSSSKKTLSKNSQSQPLPSKALISDKTLVKPIEEIELAPVMEPSVVSNPVNPVNPQEKAPVAAENKTLPKTSTNTKPTINAASSVQNLTIAESRKVARSSDNSNENEDDLSAMIRAVTAQFNREQAIQKRQATKQASKEQVEKDRWQAQAASEAIEKMLALAADQAEKQNSDQAELDNEMDNTVETVFKADYGSWQEGEEPTTSIPSLVWRSVNTSLGDVFIVMLELHINKEGVITEVQLLESSGSPIIDAIATTQVRAGQLNPLKNDGNVVDAIVPMSLVYERP